MKEKNKQFFVDDILEASFLSSENIDRLIHDLKQIQYRDKYDEAIKVQAEVIEIKLLK